MLVSYPEAMGYDDTILVDRTDVRGKSDGQNVEFAGGKPQCWEYLLADCYYEWQQW
jgi:hypothetical protein